MSGKGKWPALFKVQEKGGSAMEEGVMNLVQNTTDRTGSTVVRGFKCGGVWPLTSKPVSSTTAAAPGRNSESPARGVSFTDDLYGWGMEGWDFRCLLIRKVLWDEKKRKTGRREVHRDLVVGVFGKTKKVSRNSFLSLTFPSSACACEQSTHTYMQAGFRCC